MENLYIDATLGVAGDMLMASLFALSEDKNAFIKTINNANIPYVTVQNIPMTKNGIDGSRMCVKVFDTEEDKSTVNHHSVKLGDIYEIIDSLNLPNEVINSTKAVYKIIASAESEVHKKPVDLVHFHEVGAMDAVADVAGVSLLIHMLSPKRIISSPIFTGSGTVKCAHGILPVPAPATAKILTDIPNEKGDINGEICTPTGAALIKHFANEFFPLPDDNGFKVGYGFGTKDFGTLTYVKSFC